MAMSYLIEQRSDGWHVANRTGGDEHVFRTREEAITWVAHFGGGGAHAPRLAAADREPYLPAHDDAGADAEAPALGRSEPYLPPEQASADGPVVDDLSPSGVEPRPAEGGPEP